MSQHLLDIDPSWANERPFYFFGPCSAESPDQLNTTAQGIAEHFDHVLFRAGIWKPRTRPDSFEGVGEVGLDWLIGIQKEFGFQVCTEVANAQHVEACLKKGIDVLWIGARTTVSPFSVQEIADALQGVDIPVFVKNPIHSDLLLWVGALERLNKAGIRRLGAIHRGFHQSDSAPYRNAPKWGLPIELMRRYATLPIICDVSHICGSPELIPSVAQRSVDLDMDGLMVETHVDPTSALSDARQQVTPGQLAGMVRGLVQRQARSDNEAFVASLEAVRSKIDQIDSRALKLIAERMELAEEIGRIKRENDITILQVARWKRLLAEGVEKGKEMGLSEEFLTDLFKAIHSESIQHQTKVMNPK